MAHAQQNGAVSTELDGLQKQYRMIEVNRKTYSEDSQNTIRMQRQQIDKLKKDNDRLKEDLALETRQAKQANNMSASAQIAKLQDQADFYTRKIETERAKINDLEAAIQKMQTAVFERRKEMGGINAARETNMQVQKQIRIHENRLDKALVKFNEALAHNKQLRETIDNLRKERNVFDDIYKKLEKELHEKKNKMAQIIDVSNAAYKARDNAQAEMISLKLQADKEHQHFEAQWSQLAFLIEKDRKEKDNYKNKPADKVVGGSGDPIYEEEQKLRKRVTKGAWGINRDRQSIHQSMEKVQSYEEAFAKIQKATKITDIDELVQTFINAEDQNFSLFNYANDLSTEIEDLEEQISRLQGNIENYSGDGQMGDQHRKKIIHSLEGTLQATESRALTVEQRQSEASQTTEALRKGIQEIYEKLHAEPKDGEDVPLGDGVTEGNMMQYLGLIESRTNELLQVYQMQKEAESPSNAVGQDVPYDEQEEDAVAADVEADVNAAVVEEEVVAEPVAEVAVAAVEEEAAPAEAAAEAAPVEAAAADDEPVN